MQKPVSRLPSQSDLRRINRKLILVFTLLIITLGLILILMFDYVMTMINPRIVSRPGSAVKTATEANSWARYEMKAMNLSLELPTEPQDYVDTVKDQGGLPLRVRLQYAVLGAYRSKTSYGRIDLFYIEYRNGQKVRKYEDLISARLDVMRKNKQLSNVTDDTQDVELDGLKGKELMSNYDFQGQHRLSNVVYFASPGKLYMLYVFARSADEHQAISDFDRVIGSWHFLKKP